MNPSTEVALLTMADHLEHNVSEEVFDMELWQSSCGSVGCAIGHTVHLIPGLELINTRKYGLTPVFLPTGAKSFAGISQALDLSRGEVVWLFDPDSYQPDDDGGETEDVRVTREMVCNRLRGFAKGEMECPI